MHVKLWMAAVQQLKYTTSTWTVPDLYSFLCECSLSRCCFHFTHIQSSSVNHGSRKLDRRQILSSNKNLQDSALITWLLCKRRLCIWLFSRGRCIRTSRCDNSLCSSTIRTRPRHGRVSSRLWGSISWWLLGRSYNWIHHINTLSVFK